MKKNKWGAKVKVNYILSIRIMICFISQFCIYASCVKTKIYPYHLYEMPHFNLIFNSDNSWVKMENKVNLTYGDLIVR